MVDERTYWNFAGVADAMDVRAKRPLILCNENGAKELKAPLLRDTPLHHASEIVGAHISSMDRRRMAIGLSSPLRRLRCDQSQLLKLSGAAR